jgi:predicted amidohydrolase
MNDMMMRVRAYENGVWLAFVHPRRCLIIDPGGKVVAANQGEQDQVVLGRVNPGKLRRELLERRRPELYGEILNRAH